MRVFAIIGVLISFCFYSQGHPLNHPFPNHTTYSKGSIKPSQSSQSELDKSVVKFYDTWKKSFIKSDCSDPGMYYVYTDEGDVKNGVPVVCVSEGQGFGMLIMPMMAGYDKDAQRIYDGMYRFVVANPTAQSKDLMSWSILKGCRINARKSNDAGDNNSATDGDLDIALSLFLADAQWGSNGAINYKEEGIKRVKAILKHEINQQKHTILLSDNNVPGDYDFFDIRTSDFMPTHLKVFNKYYPNPEWSKVVDRTYQIFGAIQKKYSPKAGLIPDFITFRSNKYAPAGANYLESVNDGSYYYNACRVPFRVGLDYILNGDERAKQLVDPMITWLQAKTKNNHKNIYAGYRLNGTPIPRYNYAAPSYVSPFVVGSMVNSNNQLWLNKGWSYVSAFDAKEYQYYENTIHMLSLLVLSGNFWLP
jgi:Endoglucanase Y